MPRISPAPLTGASPAINNRLTFPNHEIYALPMQRSMKEMRLTATLVFMDKLVRQQYLGEVDT